jgi:hypothetical protein
MATKKKSSVRDGVADHTDSFDRAIDGLSRGLNAPPHLSEAAVYVRDTFELSWKAAESVFGKHATPELAVAIFDRINAERKNLVEGEPV